jgi:CheY-like chemotaxis protein
MYGKGFYQGFDKWWFVCSTLTTNLRNYLLTGFGDLIYLFEPDNYSFTGSTLNIPMDKQKPIVLIVDDTVLFRKQLKEILEDKGAMRLIEEAGSYAEGVEKIDALSPAVVLLDIGLPDKSGIELLKYISKKHTHTEVVMITNNVNDYYKKQCKALGAGYFIDKSNQFEMISRVIEEIVSKKEK